MESIVNQERINNYRLFVEYLSIKVEALSESIKLNGESYNTYLIIYKAIASLTESLNLELHIQSEIDVDINFKIKNLNSQLNDEINRIENIDSTKRINIGIRPDGKDYGESYIKEIIASKLNRNEINKVNLYFGETILKITITDDLNKLRSNGNKN